jgi:ribosomal-protein-alanine N-acetyltransferase
MRIRGFRLTDIETMFQLDLVCFAAPYQFDREMIQDAALAPGAIVVVIDDDAAGEMLGFVIAHPQGKGQNRYAYIVTIDVSPQSRRSGIGAQLLRQVEAHSSAASLHRVGLHVAVDNASAIAFYERHGYERVGIEKGFYREAGIDAYIYVKAI